jgi:hypothetical protein
MESSDILKFILKNFQFGKIIYGKQMHVPNSDNNYTNGRAPARPVFFAQRDSTQHSEALAATGDLYG